MENVVVADDGLYFVDLTSVVEPIENIEGLKRKQGLYFSQVLKDFSIFFGQYNNYMGKHKTRKELLDELADVVNNSELDTRIKIGSEVNIKLPYAELDIPYKWVGA